MEVDGEVFKNLQSVLVCKNNVETLLQCVVRENTFYFYCVF